jgi:hypothetical protein
MRKVVLVGQMKFHGFGIELNGETDYNARSNSVREMCLRNANFEKPMQNC